MLAVSQYQGKPCLRVKVVPGASKNQLVSVDGDAIKIKIHAQPEKGKANEELVSFLADLLSVRKSAVSVVQGTTSRTKLVAVDGCDSQSLTACLQRLNAAPPRGK